MYDAGGRKAARFPYERGVSLDPYYLWGRITRPQGVKGEMKVDTDLDDPAFLSGIRCAFIKKDAAYVPFPVRSALKRNADVFITSDEVPSRNEAEALRGTEVYLAREENPLPEHTDLVSDLLGCRVVTVDTSEDLGQVTNVLPMPAQDVYCIKNGCAEYFVPALLSVFPKVDAEKKILYADSVRFRETAVRQDS